MEEEQGSPHVVIRHASARVKGDHVVLSLKVQDNHRKRLVSIEAPMTETAANELLIGLLNPKVVA